MKISLRKKKTKSGDFSLYLDYYDQGKRSYEFLNLFLYAGRDHKEQNSETLALAKKIKSKRELETNSENFGFVSSAKKKILLSDYFLKVIESRNIRNNSKSYYYAALSHLNKFQGNRKFYIYQIDKIFIEKFIKYLFDQELNQNSIREYISKFEYVIKHSIKDKIILENPFNNVSRVKKIESKRNHLSIEQIQKLSEMDCIDPETKRAFLFCCFTGLRFSDCNNLTYGEIKNGEYIEMKQRKTSDTVFIPLSETAKKLIYRETNIIPLQTQKVFKLKTLASVEYHLKKWFEKAEINMNATFHISRHSFAVLGIAGGIDLFTLSKLLGHKDLQSTQIYAKVLNEQKIKAINKLPYLIFEDAK